MAQWTKTDAADNSPVWAPSQFGKAPTRTEANLLFGNTTADAYKTGTTIGMYGVNDTEINQLVFHVLTATPADHGTVAYVVGDNLAVANTLAGDGNTHVIANVSIDTVEVNAVSVGVSGGTGYVNTDTITFSTGTATTDAVFTVTTGVADTIATTLVLTTRGVYTVEPDITDGATTALTGSGTGAQVDAFMRMKDLSMAVEGVYTAVVNVSSNPVTGGTGTGAELLLTMSGGMSDGKIAGAPGWVVRTVGTGGRAGRVQAECLVAIGDMGGDAEDVAFPEFPDET